MGTLVATLAHTISGIFLCDGAFRIPPKKCQILPPTNPKREERIYVKKQYKAKQGSVLSYNTKHKSISSIINNPIRARLSVYTSA
jgi:hypothetical protein